MADFKKRFDVQLKQELSDHGSSITGIHQHTAAATYMATCVMV
jgi:hypothetical protein